MGTLRPHLLAALLLLALGSRVCGGREDPAPGQAAGRRSSGRSLLAADGGAAALLAK